MQTYEYRVSLRKTFQELFLVSLVQSYFPCSSPLLLKNGESRQAGLSDAQAQKAYFLVYTAGHFLQQIKP